MSLPDMDYINEGDIYDLSTEAGNDNYEYCEIATQDDFNRF